MGSETGLVLTRKVGEDVVIDHGRIRVRVVRIDGQGKVRLWIAAERSVSIDRGEIHEKRKAEGTA